MTAETIDSDFRWRRVRVSSELLSAFLRGEMDATQDTSAPRDLAVIGLTHVQPGPHGWVEFVVWSSTFAPVPNDGERRTDAIPEASFSYTAKESP